MKTLKCLRLASILAAMSAGLVFAVPATAQDLQSAPNAGSHVSTTTSSSKATAKAQRKIARKQARAKRTADLKKLEANGYNPSANDNNYPNNLQSAEKKSSANGSGK
jgi:hypothetical protein